MSQPTLPPLSPPVFLKAAARQLWNRRREVTRIAIVPYLAIVLLQLALPGGSMEEILSGYRFFALVLLTVAMNLSFWNQCLRMADSGDPGSLIPPVGVAEMRLFARLIAVSILVFLAASIPTQILLGLAGGGIDILLVNAGIVIAVFAYVLARLLPWLSAPALGTKESISSSLAETAEESMRLFAMSAIALAPFLIVAVVLPLLGSKILVVLTDRAATLALIAYLAFLQARLYAYLRRRRRASGE